MKNIAFKSLLAALLLSCLCAQGLAQNKDDAVDKESLNNFDGKDGEEDPNLAAVRQSGGDDEDEDGSELAQAHHDEDEDEDAADLEKADLAQVSKTKWEDVIKDRTSPDYFEYPACLPTCLTKGMLKRNAAGKKVKFPMYQKKGSVYKAHGKCYLATTNCFGCIGHPKRYPNHLRKLTYCPSREVQQLWSRLKTFRHYAIKQWLTKTDGTAGWLKKALKIKISKARR